jgi:hypothetical protein
MPREESPLQVVPVSIPEQQLEVDEIEERYSSSPSSPSSIFSIPPEDDPRLLSQLGVLREGTATPSESHGGRVTDDGGKSGDDSKGGVKDGDKGRQGGAADGETPDNQDVNSEPNDSSAEEESGEDSQTLMDNLSLKLEERGSRELGVAVRPGEELNLFLATLRKKVLTWLVDNVMVVEEVGGMRAMCYLQVRVVIMLLSLPDHRGHTSMLAKCSFLSFSSAYPLSS